MNFRLEYLASALREARERKALSQRAASRLSGVRQYQISKIENGLADARLSTLLQLSRAVDLELRLVPRKALPAVDSLLRGLAHPAAGGPEAAGNGQPPPAYRLDDD